ncbi:MAG: YceD family protein [Hyphomicrobium sp.]
MDDIPKEGITLTVEANAAEREALACRFGAVAIESLKAQVSLHPEQGRACWQVEGRVLGQVVQECVVTLNLVRTESEFTFERCYATNIRGGTREELRREGDAALTLDQDDAPEMLTGGVIDLGEIVAEEFALSLDPFPRAAGVVFNGYSTEADNQNNATSAFAALANRHSVIEKKR